MARINEEQLMAQIKGAKFSPLYFLCSDEPFLSQKYAKMIAERVVPKGMESFNLHRFDGGECTVNDIANAVEALPLMCERKCVLVCDFNADAAAQSDIDDLLELISDPAPECVQVFWFDSVEVNEKKSAKWRKILKKAEKSGSVCMLKAPIGTELARLLCDSAAEHGCKMDRNAALKLIELSGEDMLLLMGELDKLCAYVGGGTITSDTVTRLATRTMDAGAFDLVKAVVAGKGEEAYELLHELFSLKAEPIALLGAIVSAYADIYRAKVAVAAGGRAEDMAEYYNYNGKEFRLRNGARDGKRLSMAACRECIDILDDADRALKSSVVDGRVILEETVARLLLVRRV